jgi:hypothetical protein
MPKNLYSGGWQMSPKVRHRNRIAVRFAMSIDMSAKSLTKNNMQKV